MRIIGDKILVKLLKKGITEAGIIIPDNVQDETVKGEVVGIGNGVEEYCKELTQGDIIVWIAYAGTWMKIEGETLGIIRSTDVVCILDKVIN